MKQLENLSKFTEKLLIEFRNNRALFIFWNSLILGFFLLPLGINISTPFMIISMAMGALLAFKRRQIIDFKDLAILCFPLLFLMMALSLLYTTNWPNGLSLLSRSVPFFLFPIIFLFVKEDKTIIRKLFAALAFGLMLSFLINIYGAFENSIILEAGSIKFDTSVNGGYSFIESFDHGGSYFVGGDLSKHVHPSYISLYILLVIIYLRITIHNKKKYVVIACLVLYLFLLASRASIFIFLLLLVLNIFYTANKVQIRNRIVMLLIAAVVFLVMNPRMQVFYERLEDFTHKENYNYTTSEQSRILIYNSCLQLIKKAPIYGYGVGDVNEILLNKYIELGYHKHIEDKYNAHNQYFQTYLQVGLAGVIFLTLPFVLIYVRHRNLAVASLLLVFVVSLIFESMLIRYNGIIIFSIIIPMLLRYDQVFKRLINFKKIEE